MTTPTEQWRPISIADGYDVSTCGRVQSRRPWRGDAGPRILSTKLNLDGYATVRLRLNDGRYIYKSVHRLVLEAFVGPMPDGMLTRHLNGIPDDNRLENLAYGTASENQIDAVIHGVNFWAKRTHCHRGHALEGDNVKQRLDHRGRRCVECERERWRRSNRRRRQKGVA